MLKNDEVLKTQLQHRTVRQFTAEPIPAATIQELITVAQHTATSHFLQSFSVLSITEPEIRRQIAAISRQKYVDGNGHLFIFVIDLNRAATITGLNQQNSFLGSTDKFFQATSDTALAVQNVVNAAENLGLGTVILGSILNDPLRLIDLLKLPPLTFPMLGLIVGRPDQATQPKPRLPQALVHFENTYQLPDNTKDLVAEYDATIKNYYAHRSRNTREETFTSLLTRSAHELPAQRRDLNQALRQQGFFLD
ncbi:NADPH-dependent oxidoreductase [Lapidilactobacillus wuchangensis]|uniref:NADPH-dependent oxidoreductase n=1 Tax=Lapidilactobacillus wuchangensis TaxID=2486001 RepID=UPI000F769D28|nr:NADPH-dependent oxidoreductase [Lapidilactobacillus wuchangensis]